jgi:hypothetical protein
MADLVLPPVSKTAFYLMERFRRTTTDTFDGWDVIDPTSGTIDPITHLPTPGTELYAWETDDTVCLFSNTDVAEFANDAVVEYHRRRPIIDWFDTDFLFSTAIGTSAYLKDNRILTINDVTINGIPLTKIGRDDFNLLMDTAVQQQTPETYFEDDYYLHLHPVPDAIYSVVTPCSRLPLEEITWSNRHTFELEVPFQDVPALIWWMEFLAWSRRDADAESKGRAAAAEKMFTDLIGPRWSAVQEKQRAEASNRPKRVKTHYR